MSDYFSRLFQATGMQSLDKNKLEEFDRLNLDATLIGFKSLAMQFAKEKDFTIDLEIGVFADTEVNALAAIWEGKDVIALSWGVFKTFYETFENVLDLPGFKWISEEERPHATFWLYEFSKTFIFFHELGHVVNGHTRLLTQKGVSSFIQEVRAFGGGQLGNRDLQTLEMDADSFAAVQTFQIFVIHDKALAIKHPELKQEYGDFATRFLMAIVAVHLVFRIFDADADFDEGDLSTHPSPPLRQYIIAQTIVAHGLRSGLMSEEKMFEIIGRGVALAEHSYSKIKGMDINDSAFQSVIGPAGTNYTRKLLRHWHVIKPQLEILKLGGKLAPTQVVLDDEI